MNALGQPRAWSVVEASANVAVGYGVAVAANAVILPLFGIHVRLADNLGIAALFSVVSIVRSYALRRAFNWLHVRGAR